MSDKPLTVNQLAKMLNKLVEQGKGRLHVAAVKDTLADGNGTFSVCEIHKAEVEQVNICDDDGFMEVNKDGSERTRQIFVLRGRWWDN
jgi:hypothetical protein